MSQTVPATAQLGPGKTGLAIGYRVLNLNRTTYSAFTTTNVAEAPASSGTYNVSGGIIAPDAGGYVIFGISGTDYAEGTIDPESSAAILAAIATLNNLSSAGAQAAAAVALAAYDAATAADVAAVAATVAAQNPASVDGSTITMRRAVTYDGTISGLSAIIPVAWTKCMFTVKIGAWQPDSQAVIQVQISNPTHASDGLILLNGATSTLANASLSVNQAGGTVTIHIEDDALAAVSADSYMYDLKFYYGTSDSVATAPATCTVNDVVTEMV